MVISIDRPTYEGLRIDIFTLALEFGIEKWLAERDEKTPKNTVENAVKKSVSKQSKVGRPRKNPFPFDAPSAAKPEVEETTSEEETEEVSAQKTYTADDVFEALKKVVASKGEPEGRAILARFGAPRRSSLDPAKFGAFIEACEQAIL